MKRKNKWQQLEEITKDLIDAIQSAYWEGPLRRPTPHMDTAMARYLYWREDYATNHKKS